MPFFVMGSASFSLILRDLRRAMGESFPDQEDPASQGPEEHPELPDNRHRQPRTGTEAEDLCNVGSRRLVHTKPERNELEDNSNQAIGRFEDEPSTWKPVSANAKPGSLDPCRDANV